MDAGTVYIDPHLSEAAHVVQPGVRASPSDHGVRQVSPLVLFDPLGNVHSCILRRAGGFRV